MHTKTAKIVFSVVSLLVLLALACGGSSPTATPPPPPTPVPPTPVPPTPEPPPTETPVPVTNTPLPPTPTNTQEKFTGGYDDFSSDYGGWETFSGAAVTNGIFMLGPFESCADIGSGDPFGCFSQCLVCGVISDYEMQVDAAYLDGVTDRTFGMVLRFTDSNGDNLVNSNDYYLDFSISIYNKYFVIWEYYNGSWNIVGQAIEDSIQPGNNINTLYAKSYEGGTDVDIYINNNYVTNVYGIPVTEGTVGLSVGGRAITAGFDNFEIFIP